MTQENAVKLSVFKPKADIFDRMPDIFDRTELPTEEQVLLSPDFQKALDAAVAKAVAAIKIPEPKPVETIVKEVRVEVPKKDTRVLVEKSELDKALKEISDLKEQLEETDRIARTPSFMPGGPGVIGIPPPEESTPDYVLTVDENKKAKWKPGTGGGSSLSGYTVSAFTELKTFDPANTSMDEVARVLASVIDDLQP